VEREEPKDVDPYIVIQWDPTVVDGAVNFTTNLGLGALPALPVGPIIAGQPALVFGGALRFSQL